MTSVGVDPPPRLAPAGRTDDEATAGPPRLGDATAATHPWSTSASRLGWLIVAVGAVLRLRQYLADRSLWRDEASLVYNILHRGYGGFTRPLSFEQGSPPGFLVVEKAVSQTFGSSELALRAVPLLCSVVALAVVLVLVRRHLSATAGLISLALCAASPWLIYYASEVKQYSSDVLVALLILLAASSVWRRGYDLRSCVGLALTGMIALPFSHAALFVLAAVGLVLSWPLVRARDGRRLGRLALVGSTWLLVWVPMYVGFERSLDADPFLKTYWANAFLPLPPTDHAGLARWGTSFTTFFAMLTGNSGLTLVFAPLAIIGVITLWTRQRGVLAMLLGPWVLVVLASSVQLYPATERLVLFLVPPLAVLVGVGTARLVAWIGPRRQLLGLGLVAVVLILSSAVTLHRVAQPAQVEELRPLLTQLQAQVRPGDAIYVASTAVPAFDYYRPHLHLARTDVVLGQAGFADRSGVAKEVDPLAGHRRVWLVTSSYWEPEGHMTPVIQRVFAGLGPAVARFDAQGSSVILYQIPARA